MRKVQPAPLKDVHFISHFKLSNYQRFYSKILNYAHTYLQSYHSSVTTIAKQIKRDTENVVSRSLALCTDAHAGFKKHKHWFEKSRDQ